MFQTWTAPALAGIVLLVLAGCHAGVPVDVKAEKPDAGLLDPSRCDDSARFLAGKTGRKDGIFAAAESSEAWKAYASKFDGAWSRLEGRQINAVRDFRNREASRLSSHGDYVFYPFSGADVLYMSQLFPDRKTYVLIGLEKVGTLPDPSRFNEENVSIELDRWSESVSSLFNKTFFLTREMDRQFRGEINDGLLPVILLLLSRMGNTIEGVRYVGVDPDGRLQSVSPADNPKAVEIRYRGRVEQRLYYFSSDLSQKFGSNQPLQRFLSSLGRPDTFLKSASFLLHRSRYGSLRNFILTHSESILEDDSGVPFHYLANAEWQLELYGNYKKPPPPFGERFQQDMADAFEEPDRVRPMGFRMGYGAGRGSSHLVYARRMPTSTAKAVGSPD